MTKHSFMAVVITMVMCGVIENVNAQTCSDRGITEGSTCGTLVGLPVSEGCFGNSSCKYKNCGSNCECVPNGVCPTSSSTQCTKTCSGEVTWHALSPIEIDTGKERGTATLLNTSTCECESVSVYRCKSGYYLSGGDTMILKYAIPAGAFTTASGIKCAMCPKAPGDTKFYITGDLPGYLVSNPGVRVKELSRCTILANKTITDSTGDYVYTTNCAYSWMSGS